MKLEGIEMNSNNFSYKRHNVFCRSNVIIIKAINMISYFELSYLLFLFESYRLSVTGTFTDITGYLIVISFSDSPFYFDCRERRH